MAKEKKVKKRKLRKKIMLLCIISYLVMVIAVSGIVSFLYYTATVDRITEEAYHYTHMAARYVDYDMIKKYKQTKTKDAEYYEVQDKLRQLRQDSGVPYIYVAESDMGGSLSYFWFVYDGTEEVDIGYNQVAPIYINGKSEKFYEKDRLLLTYSKEEKLVGTSYVIITDEMGKYAATVAIDFSLREVVQSLRNMFFFSTSAIILVAVICIYIFYRKSTKEIIEPINNVNRAAQHMLDHIDRETRLKIDCNTGDEIEELAHSFEKMDSEVKQYIKKNAEMAADKERIETELSVATHIQASMLPSSFPINENYVITASMTPAKEVGGDFYDFFELDDTHIGFVMADVAGKGVPAALFMVNAKALIKETAMKEQDLGKLFEQVNKELDAINTELLFVTAFLGVLNLKTGKFSYVNAGHEPLYVKKANGKFEKMKLKSAVALACLPNAKYTEEFITLEPGDRIFQYTDGITEAINEAGEFYDFDRLTESLNKHANESTDDLIKGVRADLDSFVNGAEQADDITMMCLDYKKRM